MVMNLRKVGQSVLKRRDCVYIGRAGHGLSGKWGNPVAIGRQCPNCGKVHTSGGDTLPCYREMLNRILDHDPQFLEPLRGKHLVCFCAPNPCHGDVIMEYLGH